MISVKIATFCFLPDLSVKVHAIYMKNQNPAKSVSEKIDFMPAERNSSEEIKNQTGLFSQNELLCKFLDSIPDIVLVLNSNRQIVYANRAAKVLCNGEDFLCLGKRPGEFFRCSNAFKSSDGCGASKNCKACGMFRSIEHVTFHNAGSTKDAHLLHNDTGNALSFRVFTTPLCLEDENFIIATLADISSEIKRNLLEKIFFHDILNTAGALHGLSELLLDASAEEQPHLKKAVHELSVHIVNEIKIQRELMEAENHILVTHPKKADSLEIIQDILCSFQSQDIARNKRLRMDASTENIELIIDKTLLRRVLDNMVKNALEAIGEGESITIGNRKNKNRIEFFVHNPGYIPEEVQMRIFQKSFSTKGNGRGLGTYSMKLLSLQYLMGDVEFTSSPEEGTTFTASYPDSM